MAKNAKAARLGSMGTKNVSLPEELEAYIDAKVASGEYAHASEVVRDGVRLLMREEAAKLDWLRKAVGRAIAGADAGNLLPADQAIAEVKRRGRLLLARKRSQQLSKAKGR
ncbi:MAG TPA: type II toxin-antitoxin system ParD family antitoxin [Candidatus Cybelea sp.]